MFICCNRKPNETVDINPDFKIIYSVFEDYRSFLKTRNEDIHILTLSFEKCNLDYRIIAQDVIDTCNNKPYSYCLTFKNRRIIIYSSLDYLLENNSKKENENCKPEIYDSPILVYKYHIEKNRLKIVRDSTYIIQHLNIPNKPDKIFNTN